MSQPASDEDTLLHFWVTPALKTWAPELTLRGLEAAGPSADPTPSDPTPGDPTPGDPTPGDPTPGDPTPAHAGPAHEGGQDSPTGVPATPPEGEEEIDAVALSMGLTLGRGGMGVVRSATQRSLDREVAIKVVRKDRPHAVHALIREARVAGRLEHPGIVPVHALCWTDEGPVLVMKRIDGASWKTLIEDPGHALWAGRGGEPLDRHLDVLLEVCHALEMAHSRGVLHRDIKPENVMVGAFGEVSLLDWGIAWLLEDTARGQRSGLVGTPACMAPEMATRGALVDERTDVFLLGATLHQVLTGQRRHTAPTTLAALEQARQVSPFAYDESVPADLAGIANRACDRDPSERFADVASFRAALEDHRAHRGSILAAAEADRELQALVNLLTEQGARTAATQSASHVDVVRRYSACRFGFGQALREWPDNPGALGGLRKAVATMVRYELGRGDPGAAAAVLAEVSEPDAALVAQVESALAEHDALLAEGARMIRMKDELRVAGNDWGRSLATLLSGVVGLSMLVSTGVLLRATGTELDGALFALGCLGGVLVNIVGVGLFRRTLLDNRAYLRLMIVLHCLWILGILVGLGGMIVGVAWPGLLLGFCTVAVTVCLTLALTFDSIFAGSALMAVLTSAAALSLPAYGIDIVGVGWIVHSSWFAWVLRPREVAPAEATGPAMWQ